MSNSRWINLSIAYLALVGAFLPFMGWTPGLTTITDELQLSYSQAGTISSVTGLVAGAMILAGGLLSARWGSKVIIVAGLTSGIVGQLLFAGADHFELVLAGRVLAGISVGFLWVGTYTMAVNWFRDSQQTGRALGIMASGDGVGAVLSLFAFAAVLAAFGWRMGLTAQATLMVALVLVVLIVSKDAPARAGAAGVLQSSSDQTATAATLKSIVNRNILVALTFWIGGVGLFSVISSWMPAILVEKAGYSESLAGFVTSSFSIAGMASALVAPLLAGRLRSKKPVIMMAGLLATVGVAAIAALLSTGTYHAVAVLIPLIGLGTYAAEPLVLAQAVESVSPKQSGAVTGIIMGVPWLVTGFAYPYVLGFIRDATGSYVGGFLVVALVTVFLCGLSPLFITRPVLVSQRPDIVGGHR